MNINEDVRKISRAMLVEYLRMSVIYSNFAVSKTPNSITHYMGHYYETRATLRRIAPDGTEKKTSEVYLAEAMSCAEAEARTTEALRPYAGEGLAVDVTRHAQVDEIFADVVINDDKYWLAKVSFTTTDERSGKDKRMMRRILVGAEDFADAYKTFVDGMRGTVSDYELVSLSLTRIVDVLRYQG